MSDVKPLTTSFIGGEVTPELLGRLDLPHFQAGLKTCKNFRVLPHGPVTNRAGFYYTIEVKDSSKSTRLIDFSFNTQQTYVIEVGDQYLRFHTNGATILESSKNITSVTKANPGVVTVTAHGYSNGDEVYVASVGGMTELNGRYYTVADVTTNTFTLKYKDGTAVDTTGFTTYTSGGTVSKVYEVATPYLEADIFDLHFVQSADVMTLTHPSYAVRELSRLTASTFQLALAAFEPTIGVPTSVSATATVGTGSVTYDYVVTAVAEDGLEQSVASSNDTCTNDLTTAGNYNTITWSAVTGAIRYNVYKLDNGLYGYIGQTATTSFIDDNIAADVITTPPEANNPFNATSDYPSTVSYFEQRRTFANTDNKPQNFWLTRSGTESNFTYSIPTQDDDAIFVKMAARKVNEIRHMVPMGDLILLTSGGVWRVAANNSDAITPANISIRKRPGVGASNVRPVEADASVIYAQARGGRVQELRYEIGSDGTGGGYRSRDISIIAPHLFDGYTIVDMTYTHAPTPTIWLVRSDGVLLGLTYVPDADVLAWHQHETDGSFESVTAVAEGDEDVLYAVVRRTINSRTVRYIEYLHSQRYAALEDWFGVDCGLTYDGSATTSITGLWHLEGKTVSLLADGAVLPQQVVTNGTLTLSQEASKVHIGLPVTADLETLPLMYQAAAMGQGQVKNVNKVFMRVHRSSGGKVGPSTDRQREYKQRTTEPYGSPPNLVSKEIEVDLDPDWNSDGTVWVSQSDPRPLTILNMVLEVALGN